jgi:hypothetical protein
MIAAILVTLWFLATVDSACIGYRVAAGRNALIRKRQYYRGAMLRGALAGQAAIAVALAFITMFLSTTADRGRLIADFQSAGIAMLKIYLPYAGVIAIGFAFRLVPSVDVRCLTSTLIFGPLVLVRPVVAILGGIAAVAASPRQEIAILTCAILIMMLGLEPLLERRQKRSVTVATEKSALGPKSLPC